MRLNVVGPALVIAVSLMFSGCERAKSAQRGEAAAQEGGTSPEVPQFEYDPTWPKQLPNNWIMGEVGAMAIDSKNHIWVNQRPTGGGPLGLGERYGLQGLAECCFPAPPIMEFDTAGNLIQAWGPIHAYSGRNPELPRDKTKEPYLIGKQVWDGWATFPDLENRWADH